LRISLRNFLPSLRDFFILVISPRFHRGLFSFALPGLAKADGQKCERCWHWEADIGQNAEHPTICAPCTKAVLEFKP
jgi:hypothetical protein